MKGIISFSISTELLGHIDTLRQDIPRSRFIVKLIEFALNEKRENSKKHLLRNNLEGDGQSLPIQRG